MTADDVAVVRELLQSAGDPERMVELTHPDCVIIEPESLPYGGRYEAGNALLELFGDVFDVFDEFDFDVESVSDAGDRVLVSLTPRATPSGGGEPFEMPVAELDRVEDGMVLENHVFYKDTARVLEALG